RPHPGAWHARRAARPAVATGATRSGPERRAAGAALRSRSGGRRGGVLSMRDRLPALAGVAYLNAGTNGPMPEAAGQAMRDELAAALERPRITKAAFDGLFAVRDRARAALARTVAAPPEQLALTSSTTQGIGLVVAGIDWSAGDEVITTTEEHPGLLSPLDVASRRHGVVVRAVAAERI